MTDQSFDKIENAIVLLRAPIENSQPNSLERKSRGKECSIITQGEEKIEENFTATYWG
jgi:hypothetical protein